jgi:hypothetical protein
VLPAQIEQVQQEGNAHAHAHADTDAAPTFAVFACDNKRCFRFRGLEGDVKAVEQCRVEPGDVVGAVWQRLLGCGDWVLPSPA